MAQSALPFDGATATAAGQSDPAAVANVQPFDNTDTFSVYNKSSAVGVFVKIRTAPVADANPQVSSVYIPPSSAMTLPLGDTSHRPPYGTGVGQTTIYYSTDAAGTTAEVAITYFNNLEL
jgi:hypothetical protein